jgi:predicted nucleic acid-binding protein
VRSVYVETSVISYLVGRRNRDLIVAAHQELTREWWEHRSQAFILFASAVVIEEAERGDEAMARARMDIIEQLRLADVNVAARGLAARLLRSSGLPAKANADALHIAVSAVNGIDYLLTWNCTHLANAAMIPRVNDICRAAGFEPPHICTPEELMVE